MDAPLRCRSRAHHHQQYKCQCFQAHSQDIAADEFISLTDTLALTETWMDSTHPIPIENHKFINQIPCTNRCGGVALYFKKISRGKMFIFLCNNLRIYREGSESEIPLILIGDSNITESLSQSLKNFLSEVFNLTLINDPDQPTTPRKKCISFFSRYLRVANTPYVCYFAHLRPVFNKILLCTNDMWFFLRLTHSFNTTHDRWKSTLHATISPDTKVYTQPLWILGSDEGHLLQFFFETSSFSSKRRNKGTAPYCL